MSVVTWSISSDVGAFLASAGGFLEASPVDHTVLLTEAAYLSGRSGDADDQRFGWWSDETGVAGAFLQAPRHPAILSLMPKSAVAALAGVLPGLPPIGVDGRLVESAVAAWGPAGLSARSRIRLYRLGTFTPPAPAEGRARVATLEDRPLLVEWYDELMAAHPGDPSELAYVVDEPLSYGGMTLWEVGGKPTAMASRSRLVAGMTRVGAVYAPYDVRHGAAAFAAACASAAEVAVDVVTFAGATDPDADADLRALGFDPVLDRVMLQPRVEVSR